MFKACFVARLEAQNNSVTLYCNYNNVNDDSKFALPSDEKFGHFCFPTGLKNVTPKEYCVSENYSFTLTGGDGSHLHGFCRSFLPPRPLKGLKLGGKSPILRYPQVICLLSPFPWFSFYFKILQVLESLLKKQSCLFDDVPLNLPASSLLAKFLLELHDNVGANPQLGSTYQIKLPVFIKPDKSLAIFAQNSTVSFESSFVELQIPPSNQNDPANAGICLSILLWHLSSQSLLALIQALLLERRILFISKEKKILGSAVHAASAILYPFKWHHIFLPMLPHCLMDYLNAPMPYLIGLPSPQLLNIDLLALDDVVIVDLDKGRCTVGGLGGSCLDANLLPWSNQLQQAFQVICSALSGPFDESCIPLVVQCMQDYFIKLMGNYHYFVESENCQISNSNMNMQCAKSNKDDGYIRQSQMYEVFIGDRLTLAANNKINDDDYEKRLNLVTNRVGKDIGRIVAQAGVKGVSNISAVLHKTSTFVKSGVQQIKYGHNAVDTICTEQYDSNIIVPSYSIDMDSEVASDKSEIAASGNQTTPTSQVSQTDKNEDGANAGTRVRSEINFDLVYSSLLDDDGQMLADVDLSSWNLGQKISLETDVLSEDKTQQTYVSDMNHLNNLQSSYANIRSFDYSSDRSIHSSYANSESDVVKVVSSKAFALDPFLALNPFVSSEVKPSLNSIKSKDKNKPWAEF